MKKFSGLNDLARNYVPGVAPAEDWANNKLQQVGQNAETGVQNKLEGWGNQLMSKAAPFLMLPVAYGLMNGNKPQQPTQPMNQPMSNYGGPIQRSPIIPQYFGQDKTASAGTAALILGSLHRKAVNAAVDKATHKDKEQVQSMPSSVSPPANISSNDLKTQKLLQHPAIKEYVDNLINS